MRESCLGCVRKHIGQTMVLLNESLLGHPEHFWLAIGHMAEAEAEAIKQHKNLAIHIRQLRKELEIYQKIPYSKFIDLIKEVTLIGEKQKEKHKKSLK